MPATPFTVLPEVHCVYVSTIQRASNNPLKNATSVHECVSVTHSCLCTSLHPFPQSFFLFLYSELERLFSFLFYFFFGSLLFNVFLCCFCLALAPFRSFFCIGVSFVHAAQPYVIVIFRRSDVCLHHSFFLFLLFVYRCHSEYPADFGSGQRLSLCAGLCITAAPVQLRLVKKTIGRG